MKNLLANKTLLFVFRLELIIEGQIKSSSIILIGILSASKDEKPGVNKLLKDCL